jgi:LacI family transcriptional regulator
MFRASCLRYDLKMANRPRITQSSIANKLGVSISTVSRALQGHPGHNRETTELVLKTAAQLGYIPNLTARALVSNRRLRIGLVTPQQILSVYSQVRQGIQDEVQPFLSMGVEVVPYTFSRLGKGEVEAFERAIKDDVSGVVLVPGDLPHLKRSFARAAEKNIPVVCLLTDAPAYIRLTTVAVNAHSCGSLAGEILSRCLPSDRRSIAIATGDLIITDHAQKTAAFRAAVKTVSPESIIYPPIENHESEEEAYNATLAFLKRHRTLGGIYIGTGNGRPVLEAVKAAGMLGKLAIVATNVFPEVISLIRSGEVAAAIFERPYSHGRIATRLLCDYMVNSVSPPQRVSLEPLLVMRSNLEAFDAQENGGMTATALL